MVTWPDEALRLGACSWTAPGWAGTFYTRTKQNEFIAEYAERYSAVEIDATFYAVPQRSTLERWRDLTPDGFIFAAKAPQLITHDKFLHECAWDLDEFLKAMALLGPKLGPILFQFPYFAKARGVTLQEFIDRLAPFLELLPRDGTRFAVEVRNKAWVCAPLLDLLHEHGVAMTLIDHPWMAPCNTLFRTQGILTAPFTYIRWLGDRHGIEKITKVFNQRVVERDADLERWVPHIEQVLEKGVKVYGFVNNHYGGYAPADIDYLRRRLSGMKSPDGGLTV